MSYWRNGLLMTVAVLVVAGSMCLAQGGMPAGPPAEGTQPGGAGWQGRAMGGVQTTPAPVMLLAPDKYLYVIYGSVLYQFDANDLTLINQTQLRPMGGERNVRQGMGERGTDGRNRSVRDARPTGRPTPQAEQ
jgi:hypothetical protein